MSGPRVCLTLDLEQDFGGRVPESYDAWSAEGLDALLAALSRRGVPLTVFVVARALERRPEDVRRLERAGCEFHLHSWSHDLENPDGEAEIDAGREAFRRFFGRDPEGYRAPEGRVTPEGWRRLRARGFLFDASVIPSFWPRPRYLRYPRAPFMTEAGLPELPFAVVSPLRLPLSVSWLRLLGWPLYERLIGTFGLPELCVVGSHLHDLWPCASSSRLGWPWSAVYAGGGETGLALLERLFDLLAARGASFTTLGRAAAAAR